MINTLSRRAVAFLAVLLCLGSSADWAAAQQLRSSSPEESKPAVTKVEPPNWWIGLTLDLMVLLSGHGLSATKVTCNLPEVVVTRTEATHGGDYLFVWLRFGPRLRSGTLICRATTGQGEASFELPLSNRMPTAQRFHGLSADDVLYLIMPDRFANGDPTNDEPEEFPG